MKYFLNVALSFCMVSVLTLSWAEPYQQRIPKDTLSILDAKLSRKLSVSIRGAYNPNKLQPDLTSAHFGQCIDIKMKNMSDSIINVVLRCGTMLLSRDSSSQNMVVTKTLFYTLRPKEKITDRVYAMCGQLHKNSPDIYIRYDVGELADEPLLRLARLIEKKDAQNKIGQYAVWAVTDNATKNDLGEDFATLAQSQALLREAKISANILGQQAIAIVETPKNISSKKQENPKKAKEETVVKNDVVTPSFVEQTVTEENTDVAENYAANPALDEFTETTEADKIDGNDNLAFDKEEEDDYILLIASVIVGLFGLYYFWKKKPQAPLRKSDQEGLA
ncbi:hypothetical protein [Thermoflexibacter ruber]|uniref:LPXTG-motif cell wall anchor domain-containing protein n=1 Tax=Thermoflexibacter ruber TaxID=1003 RepID=A0A1I2GHX5_9BACT|nr:hypothetical protein [Thermoflexibacter ruber]SFF16467.1 hypothetical protein SAMN04488541_101857 [Thermoflexibacter ruber]